MKNIFITIAVCGTLLLTVPSWCSGQEGSLIIGNDLPEPLPVAATANPAMPFSILAAVPELLTNAPFPPMPVPLMVIGSLIPVVPLRSSVNPLLTVVPFVAVV